MKKVFFVLLFLNSTLLIAQFTPSITFDSQSGNYILEYEGYEGENDSLVFVRVIYEPTTKINPFIWANVSKYSDTSGFYYQYKLKNDISSKQRLEDFDIEILSSIQNIKSPDNFWKHSFYSFVPVFGWYNTKGEYGLADPFDGIAPDSIEDGFSFISSGLPAISNAYFKGKSNIILAFPAEPPAQIEMFLDTIDVFPNYCVIRKTIGPKSVPDPFIAITFLDTLLSYTRQSVQLGWLKNGKDNDCDLDEKPDDGVVKNLENRLLKARNELNEGDTVKASPIGASRELEKFIKKVERISKRSDVMTGEAYALLKYNAEYLLERLITLPPKSIGTILQQIDSLKIEVQNQSKKKNIGGVIFVKGLTLLIDKARKELVKKDSSETALYIALFQLVVDETWELTQKLEEKKKKLAALYVLDEAYIALHHRAEYILEALPEPRRSVHEQRQQMMKEDSSLKEIQQELGTMKKSVE
jgi:hypothetical protein